MISYLIDDILKFDGMMETQRHRKTTDKGEGQITGSATSILDNLSG